MLTSEEELKFTQEFFNLFEDKDDVKEENGQTKDEMTLNETNDRNSNLNEKQTEEDQGANNDQNDQNKKMDEKDGNINE